jgi:Tfp pilus assembly protein PilE
MKTQSGFTVIELLLIIAAGGLALSVVFVIFSSLRLKTGDIKKLHDARRVSDMVQIRTGLELFYSNTGGYPDEHQWVTGGLVSCNKSSILIVPRDPSLTGSSSGYNYRNRGVPSISSSCGGVKIWSDYSLEFNTETKSYLGPAGTYCMTTKGMQGGTCP